MDRDRDLLRHFLAAIAYRTQRRCAVPLHEMVGAVGDLLSSGAKCSITREQLLQGPADSPVAPENFIYAEIQGDRLGTQQAPPARPDKHWPERPE